MSLDTVAGVTYDVTGDTRWALVTLKVSAAEAAPVLVEHLAGHRVVTNDDDLAALLVAAGGRLRRKAHDYTYDVTSPPAESPLPQGFHASRDLDVAALESVRAAAYPPEHPDHRIIDDPGATLPRLLSGSVLGPVVGPATWQVSDDHGPVAAIVVSERSPVTAWVLDVFADPRHRGRGLGRALLTRAVRGVAQAGLPALGLVVSDGNPARRLYEAVGFTHVLSGSSVDLPLPPRRPT